MSVANSPTAEVTDARVDWALLAVRLSLGSLFLAQGATKWGWFGGTDPPGMGGLEQFLQILGYDSRTALAWVLTVTEVSAGLLLIVGALTPLAAAGVIGIAFNGMFVLSWKGGFANGYGAWIVFMTVATALALAGPGRFSLDHVAPWRSIRWIKPWLFGVRAGVGGVAIGLLAGVLVVTTVGPGFNSERSFEESLAAGDDAGLVRWCRLVEGINEALGLGGSIPDETFDEVVEAAPVDVLLATQTASEALKESSDDAFDDPQVQTAVQEIEAYSAANCQ